MRSREGRDHRHRGHDAADRQHGFDALTRCDYVACCAETNRMSEKVAHRPARRCDWRLAAPRRIEPGAVRAGDVSLKVGNSRDHCGPGFGWGVSLGTVVAARMESQAVDALQIFYATLT